MGFPLQFRASFEEFVRREENHRVNAANKLEQLKQTYLRSLSAKSDEIDRQWQRVLETDFDSRALRDLKVLVHRISGSAGMYGLGVVSAGAQRIDQQLTAAHAVDRGWRANLKRSVEDLLVLLRESADRR